MSSGKTRAGTRSTPDDGVLSLVHGIQHLELGTRPTKRIRHKEVEPEFASNYGTNESVKEKWQAFCQDCGIDPLPSSIKKCKKVQPRSATQSAFAYAHVVWLTLGTQKLEC